MGANNFDDVGDEPMLFSVCQQCDKMMMILEELFPEDSIISKINVQVNEIGHFRLLVRSVLFSIFSTFLCAKPVKCKIAIFF